MKKPRREKLHFLTLVSAPYVEALIESKKAEKTYEKARRLQKRDPAAGSKALADLRKKQEATHPERLKKLLAGTKLGGVFKTRAQARKATARSGTCLAEMGYYQFLVIEDAQTGFSDFWPHSRPEWWKLGRTGYSPCPTPKWAERICGFCI